MTRLISDVHVPITWPKSCILFLNKRQRITLQSLKSDSPDLQVARCILFLNEIEKKCTSILIHEVQWNSTESDSYTLYTIRMIDHVFCGIGSLHSINLVFNRILWELLIFYKFDIIWLASYHVLYYTPVFRRDVLWYGDVRPSGSPSDSPSVRPGLRPPVFHTFLIHALTYWAEILHITLF